MAMDGSMSLWHWIFFILSVVIFGVPIAKILTRAGWSRWWTIVFFVPLLNLIILWVFAFGRWPTVDAPSSNPGAQQL